MVRLFDSLGPQFVTGTTQPIADALQAKGSVAGQIRSMLLSLLGPSLSYRARLPQIARGRINIRSVSGAGAGPRSRRPRPSAESRIDLHTESSDRKPALSS